MNDRMANIFGALVLGIADDIVAATDARAPEAGHAAAAVSLVGHEPGISVERLRTAFGLSHGGTVRLVDRLEAHGLVQRKESPIDRRAVALHLTQAGRRTRKAIVEGRDEVLARGLDALSSRERRMLGRLAEKMLRAALRNDDHAYEICRLCDHERCADCPVERELEERAATVVR